MSLSRHVPRSKLLCALVASCFATEPFANPVGPAVISGQASFSTVGKSLTVTNSPNAIINWQGFSIGAGEITRFQQQSASSSVLNRVVGQDPSAILGTLSSNGRVYLINPNGILFGQGSRVDVAGLVATTLNLSNNDFLAGRLNFEAGAVANSIVNQGEIVSGSGGRILLIAPDVQNSGLISSPQGEVVLAAGKSVQLVEADLPMLKVEVQSGGEALNVGRIITEGGKIGVYAGLINQRGVVKADSVTRDATGRIAFRASDTTILDAGSVTSASGTKGGEIQVLGNKVGLVGDAKVDASGDTGGGTVLVGGDFQGKNPEVQNAFRTYFGPDAAIKADATTSGDGGKVIVWSDDATRAYGTISARGGAQAGNGGFVEVSGKKFLDFGAAVDTRAPNGVAGTLLLDPTTIWIAVNQASATTAGMSGTDTSIDGDLSLPDLFAAPVAESLLTTGKLTTALATSNVTVATRNPADTLPGAGAGDINVVDPVSWSSGRSLTLLAENNVNVNAPVTNAGLGTISMYAGWNGASTAAPVVTSSGSININQAVSTLGNVILVAGDSITQTGVASVITAAGLSALAGNQVLLDQADNLIGTVAGAVLDCCNGLFSLKNGQDLTVGTVAVTSGISAVSGDGSPAISLNVTGNLTIDQPVTTTGAGQTISGVPTSIGLSATGLVDIKANVEATSSYYPVRITGGSIMVRNGAVVSMTGYGAAAVELTASNGGIEVTGGATISAAGGAGGEGNVSLVVNVGDGGITVNNGTISATGGAGYQGFFGTGSANGYGGGFGGAAIVTLSTANEAAGVRNISLTQATITATGGKGGDGGAAELGTGGEGAFGGGAVVTIGTNNSLFSNSSLTGYGHRITATGGAGGAGGDSTSGNAGAGGNGGGGTVYLSAQNGNDISFAGNAANPIETKTIGGAGGAGGSAPSAPGAGGGGGGAATIVEVTNNLSMASAKFTAIGAAGGVGGNGGAGTSGVGGNAFAQVVQATGWIHDTDGNSLWTAQGPGSNFVDLIAAGGIGEIVGGVRYPIRIEGNLGQGNPPNVNVNGGGDVYISQTTQDVNLANYTLAGAVVDLTAETGSITSGPFGFSTFSPLVLRVPTSGQSIVLPGADGPGLSAPDVTLIADSMSLFGTVAINASGTAKLQPYSTNLAINVADSGAGILFTPATLQKVVAGTLEIGRTTDTGLLTVGPTLDMGTLSVGTLRLAHQNVTLAANISKSTGSDQTLDVRAGNDVLLNSGVAISSASNKLNVILNSDRDGVGGGQVAMASGSSITSNGGDVTLVGGTNPLAAGTGNISVDGGTLNAANLNLVGNNISVGSVSATAPSGVFSSGAMTINAAGTLTLQGANSGTGRYAAVSSGGGQTISAANITLKGGDSGSGNYANIAQTGALATQDVSVAPGGTLELKGGGGFGNSAVIYSNGAQQNITFASTGQLLLRGGGGASSDSANIGAGAGTQTISGAPSIVLTGGTGGDGTLNGSNYAIIGVSSGGQAQIIEAASITLSGGLSGTRNRANILQESTAAQTITIKNDGFISLTGGGGTQNTAYILAKGSAQTINFEKGGRIDLTAGSGAGGSNEAGIGPEDNAAAGPTTITFGTLGGTPTVYPTITVTGDPSLSGTGMNNDAFIASRGDLTIKGLTASFNPDITLKGGNSGGSTSLGDNGAHIALWPGGSGTLLTIIARNISLNGGDGGTFNHANIATDASGQQADITATGSLIVTGGAGTDAWAGFLGQSGTDVTLDVTGTIVLTGGTGAFLNAGAFAGIGFPGAALTGPMAAFANLPVNVNIVSASGISLNAPWTPGLGTAIIGTSGGGTGNLIVNAGVDGVALGGGTSIRTNGTLTLATTGALALTAGNSGTNVTATIHSAGDQNISAKGISLQGGSDGLGNVAYISTAGNQDITVDVDGITLRGGGGSQTDNAAYIYQSGTTLTYQRIRVDGTGSIVLQGGTSEGFNVGGVGHGSRVFIQAEGDTQDILFTKGGSISVTGGDGGTAGTGSRNLASIIANRGMQTIGVHSDFPSAPAPSITLKGGASGGYVDHTNTDSTLWINEGNFALIRGTAGQSITASTIRLEGGDGGTQNYAQIFQGPSGSGNSSTTQTISATAITLKGGADGGATSDLTRSAGNDAAILSRGSQDISVGSGGLTLTGGSGGRLYSDNSARIEQWSADQSLPTPPAPTGTQKITVTDGFIELRGGSSQRSNVGGRGHGSRASIYSEGTEQWIDFQTPGGSITLTGGSGGVAGTGSRNFAQIFAENTGAQKITGAPDITLMGGPSGGFVDATNPNPSLQIHEGNSAYISTRGGAQNIDASAIVLQGGSGGLENYAAIVAGAAQTITATNLALDAGLGGTDNFASIYTAPPLGVTITPPQIITVTGTGNLDIAGHASLSSTRGGGARIGGPGGATPTLGTDLTLTVGGNVTLTGGDPTSPAIIGTSGLTTSKPTTTITMDVGGDVTLIAGNGLGTRIGSPRNAVGGGVISVSAGNSIDIGVGTGIFTKDTVTLTTTGANLPTVPSDIVLGGSIDTSAGTTGGITLDAAGAIVGAGGLLSTSPTQDIFLTAASGIGTQLSPVRINFSQRLSGAINGSSGDIAISVANGDVTLDGDFVDFKNNNPTGSYFVNVETGNFQLDVAFTPGGLPLDSGQSVVVTAPMGSITLNAGGKIEALGSGNVTLSNVPSIGPNTGANALANGVWLNGGTVSTEAGTISITGQGKAGTGLARGVLVTNGALVQTTTGAIDITGTGGDGTGVPGGRNRGIQVTGARISAGDGSITLSGTGGNSSGTDVLEGTDDGNNRGIHISGGAVIETTGTSPAATIRLTGIGGSSVAWGQNSGILIDACSSINVLCDANAGTRVTTVNGDIFLTGTGGATTGASATVGSNRGVSLVALVQSTGTGSIFIDGAGGSSVNNTATSTNSGVLIQGSSGAFLGRVLAAGGNIEISGTSGTTNGVTAGNEGILIASNALVQSSGAAATQILNATGDLVLLAEDAPVSVQSAGTQYVSASGNLNLTAGTGSGASVMLQSDGSQTIGATNITLIGGASGSNNQATIEQTGAGGTQVVTVNNGGTLWLKGGSGSGNHAQIASAGTSQVIGFDAGGTLRLSGGDAGQNNGAYIFKQGGSQLILGNTGDPAIVVQGGGAGSVGNDAAIGARSATQTVWASSVTLSGGAGTNASAVIGGDNALATTVNVSGATILSGGSGDSAAAAIGSSVSNVNIVLNAGGPVTLTGGTGGVAIDETVGAVAAIGAAGALTADVLINGDASITFHKGGTPGFQNAFIGSQGGAGTVTLKAGLAGSGNIALNDGLVGTTGALALHADAAGGQIMQIAGGGLSAGTLDASAAAGISLAGFNNVGGGVLTAPLITLAGTLTSGGPLSLSATDLTMQSGNLGGTGPITVNGGFNWTGGTMSGSGTTTVAPGSTMTVSGANAKVLSGGRTLNIDGTAQWLGGRAIDMQNATVNVSSGGVFDVQADGRFFDATTGASPNTINVLSGGTLRKSGGTGVSEQFGSAVAQNLNNDGAVDVQAGTLQFAGANHSGTFNVATGAFFNFHGGLNALQDGATFTGGGTSGFVSGAGGGLNLAGTGTGATVAPGATLSLGGISVSGSGKLTNQGTLNLSGTSISGSLSNSGTATANSASLGTVSNQGALNLAGSSVSGLLTNSGTVGVTGTTNATGGIQQNAGLLTVPASQTLSVGGSGLVLAGGTLLGAGTISGNVNNSGGTVSPGASLGILTINGNYTQGSGGALAMEIGGTTAGTQYDQLIVTGNAALGGTLSTTLIGGYTPAPGDSYTLVQSGTVGGTFGSVSLPTDTLMSQSYGATSFSLGVTSVINRWNSAGAGDWATASNWSRGRVPNANEDVLIDDGLPTTVSTITISGGTQSARSIVTGENLTLSGGSLNLAASSTVNSLSVAGGTLTANGPLATSAVSVAGGTLTVNGSLTSSSVVSVSSGRLNGTGTINGSVSQTGGTVAPGSSPGILTINGNYTQGASGILEVEIGGTTAGTQYDQLVVTGTATLNGTLSVLAGTTAPVSGVNYTVITCGTCTGQFSSVSADPAVVGVTAAYPGTSVNLSLPSATIPQQIAAPLNEVITQTTQPAPFVEEVTKEIELIQTLAVEPATTTGGEKKLEKKPPACS